LEQVGDEEGGTSTFNLNAPIQGPADKGLARQVFLGILSAEGAQFKAAPSDGGPLPPDLENPAWRVEAWVRAPGAPKESAIKRTLLIGPLHPANAETSVPWMLVKRDDDQWIARIHGELNQVLGQSLDALKDKRLFRFSRNDIVRVDMQLKPLGRVSLEKNGEGDKATWVMLSPQPGTARTGVMQMLLLTFANLNGTTVVAEGDAASEKAILDLTGLSTAAQSVTFLGADQKKLGTLIIGDADGESTYVMAANEKAIYKVPTTQIKALPADLDLLLQKEETP
jgi:hypothetical protein